MQLAGYYNAARPTGAARLAAQSAGPAPVLEIGAGWKGTIMTTVTVPENDAKKQRGGALSRRHMLLTGTSALAAAGLAAGQVSQAEAQPARPPRPAATPGASRTSSSSSATASGCGTSAPTTAA